MSYQPYPKYKDSGVEWLGQVPEHWDVSPLKRIVSMPITDGPHETPKFIDEGVPFVSAEAVSSGRIDFSKVRACISAEDNARYSEKYFPKLYDIYMVKSGATTGVTAIVEDRIDFNIWSPLAVIRCGEDAVPHFVLNFMRSKNFLEAVTLNWSFGTQQNIGMGVIENLFCTLPPIEEQALIAAFLDRETGRIDTLIAEQEKLITLLQEKRQAVISHAVTKGLNPNAPMKPSGIDWLGDVPKHWDITPLKYLVSLKSGGTPSKENLAYWNGDIPWASSKDLKSVELSDTQDHITQLAIDEGAAELVPAGCILTVVRGMILLHTFPVVVATVPMAINQDLKALTPKPPLNPGFLAWLLRGASAEVLGRTDEAAHGTKVLRMDLWLSMPVPVPPLNEQAEIVTALLKKLDELDSLVTEVQHAIDLLKERRSALISAAVTGSIDVRADMTIPVSAPAKPYSIGFARQLLAAEILSHCYQHSTMGRVKLQKLIQLCEGHAQIEEIDGHYMREAAGPFDNKLMYGVAAGLKKLKWFEEVRSEGRTIYRPLKNMGDHTKYLELWSAKLPKIQQVLKMLGHATTQQCEIVSTLYAAWNDLIIEGKCPKDREIIKEASSPSRWHEAKANIPAEKWPVALHWMKEHSLIPVGFGGYTKHSNS